MLQIAFFFFLRGGSLYRSKGCGQAEVPEALGLKAQLCPTLPPILPKICSSPNLIPCSDTHGVGQHQLTEAQL